MNEFSKKVLTEVKNIPESRVSNYGQIALRAGKSRAAREVGWILNQSDNQDIPWWRVVNKEDHITFKGSHLFSAHDQILALKAEGIKIENYRLDIKKYGYKP